MACVANVFNPTNVNGCTYFMFPFIGSRVMSPEGHQYQLLKFLGKGSFGQAFEVVHTTTGYRYAMKVMDTLNEDQERETMKEINNHLYLRSSRAYDAPLLEYVDFFRVDNKMCVVTEKLDCTLLDVVIELSGASMEMNQLRSLAYQMLHGVARLHGLGVCHADLKTDNVMYVNRSGHNPFDVKLIDFGLLIDIEQLRNSQNSYFMARGYRAPEVFLGLPLDEKVDVWSVGVMMYELFTGRDMFSGRTDGETMHQMASVFGLPTGAEQYGTFYGKYFSFDLYTSSHRPSTPITYDASCYRTPGVFANLPQFGFHNRKLGTAYPIDFLFQDLLSRLLAVDSCHRISAADALKHPFFCGFNASPV